METVNYSENLLNKEAQNNLQCISLSKSNEHQCAWERSEPNPTVYFIYAIVIPVLAMFGFLANFLNALVFMRPKMTQSVFIYFAALSWTDCLCCFIILVTSMSRSVFFNSTSWIIFDFQWQTPLFGILTGGANWILASITLDRMIYLRQGLPLKPPAFCNRQVAKRNICGIMLMSALLNTPYFFIFVVREDGTFYTTNFYCSKFYRMHNWLTFIVLCILPGLFLLGGNAVVIIIFRRWVRKSKARCSENGASSPEQRSRHRHQTKLTITVIVVVFLYLVGELPAHITSRKSAVNLLFGGDATKISFKKMEHLEVIFLTLNALQLSFNIVVYAIVNPVFMSEFFIFLQEASDVFYVIIGVTLIQKCWKKIREKYRHQPSIDEVNVVQCFENRVSVSYYNETFNIEEEYNLCRALDDIRVVNLNRSWKSSFDLRLDYEDWSKSGRILQRHSLSF